MDKKQMIEALNEVLTYDILANAKDKIAEVVAALESNTNDEDESEG